MADQLHLGPTPTRVGHVRHDAEEIDVYVGRGSKWGNPYVPHGRAKHSQHDVIEVDDPLYEYEQYVRGTKLILQLHELRGRVLGCYCVRLEQRPRKERCHAQVLARMADAAGGTA